MKKSGNFAQILIVLVVAGSLSCSKSCKKEDDEDEGGGVVSLGGVVLHDSQPFDFGLGVTDVAKTESVTVTLAEGAVAAVTEHSFEGPFAFTGGTFPGEGGTCTAQLVNGCTVSLDFTPTEPGTHSGSYQLNYGQGGGFQSVKMDLSGTANAFSFGNVLSADGEARGAAVDGSGANYVTGFYMGTMTLGDLTFSNAAGASAYIVKYSPSGELVWAKSIGTSPNSVTGRRVRYDAQCDCIYLAGEFTGDVDLNTDEGVEQLVSSNAGSKDFFLLKLETSGAFVSGLRWGSQNDDYLYGLTIDIEGSLYLSGDFNGDMDFDPGAGDATRTIATVHSYFVKLDRNLDYQMNYIVGGGSIGVSCKNDVAIDGDGSIYFSGYFNGGGNIDFDDSAGDDLKPAVGNQDGFLVKVDSTGAYQWVKLWATVDIELTSYLAASGDTVYATVNYTAGPYDIDPTAGVTEVAHIGNRDIAIVALGKDGSFKWGTPFATDDYDNSQELLVMADGSLAYAGAFRGVATFVTSSGTVNFDAEGVGEAAVLLFSSTGELSDFYYVNTDALELSNGKALATDGFGNILFAGYTGGTVDLDVSADGELSVTTTESRQPFYVRFSP